MPKMLFLDLEGASLALATLLTKSSLESWGLMATYSIPVKLAWLWFIYFKDFN